MFTRLSLATNLFLTLLPPMHNILTCIFYGTTHRVTVNCKCDRSVFCLCNPCVRLFECLTHYIIDIECTILHNKSSIYWILIHLWKFETAKKYITHKNISKCKTTPRPASIPLILFIKLWSCINIHSSVPKQSLNLEGYKLCPKVLEEFAKTFLSFENLILKLNKSVKNNK